MHESYVPDFIRSYMEQMGDIAYVELQILGKQYAKTIEEYKSEIFPKQQRHLDDSNKRFNENKKLNLEAGLEIIKNEYKKKAQAIAIGHGFDIRPDELAKEQKKEVEKSYTTDNKKNIFKAQQQEMTANVNPKIALKDETYISLADEKEAEIKLQQNKPSKTKEELDLETSMEKNRVYFERAGMGRDIAGENAHLSDEERAKNVLATLEAEKQERLQRLQELNAIEPSKSKDKGFTY